MTNRLRCNKQKSGGHTPGPRTVYGPNMFRAHWVVESDEGNLLVNIMESDNPGADAQLIAVAPELLEACEAGSTNILGDGHWLLRTAAIFLDGSDQPAVRRMADQLRYKARLEEAAIAKVKGE